MTKGSSAHIWANETSAFNIWVSSQWDQRCTTRSCELYDQAQYSVLPAGYAFPPGAENPAQMIHLGLDCAPLMRRPMVSCQTGVCVLPLVKSEELNTNKIAEISF